MTKKQFWQRLSLGTPRGSLLTKIGKKEQKSYLRTIVLVPTLKVLPFFIQLSPVQICSDPRDEPVGVRVKQSQHLIHSRTVVDFGREFGHHLQKVSRIGVEAG